MLAVCAEKSTKLFFGETGGFSIGFASALLFDGYLTTFAAKADDFSAFSVLTTLEVVATAAATTGVLLLL